MRLLFLILAILASEEVYALETQCFADAMSRGNWPQRGSVFKASVTKKIKRGDETIDLREINLPVYFNGEPSKITFRVYFQDSDTNRNANLLVSDPQNNDISSSYFGTPMVVAKFLRSTSSWDFDRIQFYSVPDPKIFQEMTRVSAQIAQGNNTGMTIPVDYSKFQSVAAMEIIPMIHCPTFSDPTM